MPSETQLVELGKLVRESRIWFGVPMRAAWRHARLRLRDALAAGPK